MILCKVQRRRKNSNDPNDTDVEEKAAEFLNGSNQELEFIFFGDSTWEDNDADDELDWIP